MLQLLFDEQPFKKCCLKLSCLDKSPTFEERDFFTSNLGGEGAARDVFVIKLDDDVVVSRCGGQVGHCACPVLVVFTADLCFGWTFNCQRQTSCRKSGNTYCLSYLQFHMVSSSD